MDATRFDLLLRALTDSAARRGVLRGLTSATLGLTAVGLFGVGEAKKQRKRTCKKCPKVDRCPQQHCCQCNDNSCHVFEAEGTTAGACATFCESLGLEWTRSANSTPGTATMCGADQQCVFVRCPVV